MPPLQTRARFDDLDGEGVTTYYDGFGQPVTALLNMSGFPRYLQYLYDSGGNRTRLIFAYPEEVYVGFAYDGLDRMTLVHDHAAATSPDDYVIRYWYNSAGSRHSAVRGAGSGGFYTVYYRDPIERPTIVANDFPLAADMVVELAYNPASQITRRSVSNDAYAAPPAANVGRGYQVNGLNQYTGTTWGGAPNWTFEYDPNGNLKRSVDPAGALTTNFVYDVENRLVGASGAVGATLVYDPLGRLVQVTNGSGAKTQFLYDGDKVIAEYDGWGALLKRYAHGPGADEPVASYDGAGLGLANRRYMLPDERGSIIGLINADGSPAVINRYDAWGIPGAGNEGLFQYTGQAWIGELRLYYYKARFYSPWLGRFMQTDPVGYDGGANLYAYAYNDPVNFLDSTGNKPDFVMDRSLGINAPANSSCQSSACRQVAGHLGNAMRGFASFPRDLGALAGYAVARSGVQGTAAENRALLVEDMMRRAGQAVERDPGEAASRLGALIGDNKVFVAGRFGAGGLAGRLVGLQAGLALTGGAALGGAIRTMNNLAQQMESGGLSTDALSNNTLGGIAAIGTMGGNVSFNSATGDVIGSITVDRPGSRLPDTRTGVICNVRTGC